MLRQQPGDRYQKSIEDDVHNYVLQHLFVPSLEQKMVEDARTTLVNTVAYRAHIEH